MTVYIDSGTSLEDMMAYAGPPLDTDKLHASEWVSSLANPKVEGKEWDFVNFTNPVQRKDRKVQKLVRVKAQKHVRRCQRKQQDPNSVSPDPFPNSGPSTARHTPSPSSELTLRDPGISRYPVQMQPYMSALIDRYVHADLQTFADIVPMRQSDLAPNPLKVEWLSLAVNEPAMFHALLLVSSIRVPTIGGEDIPSKALLHQSQSIRLINEAINDERAADDSIIGAVLALTGYECAYGNYEAWRVHMSGLEALIKSRGGIQNCGWLLRRMIYIIDHVGSALVSRVPRFPLVDDDSSHSSPFIQARGKFGLIEIPHIDPDMAAIFNDLRALISMLDISDGRPPLKHAQAFALKRESIEFRLCSFYHGDNRWTDTGRLDECCRLALLIYMNTITRHLRPVAPVIINLTVWLRTALLELGQIAGFVEVREVMFWILFAGGRIASGTTREWFVAKLRELALLMDVSPWTSCRRVLKQVVWFSNAFEADCRKFWYEIVDSDDSSGHDR